MRLIDANALIDKLIGHHDFFVDAWGGFGKMSFASKCRVDEIDNCIAEVVDAPTVDAVIRYTQESAKKSALRGTKEQWVQNQSTLLKWCGVRIASTEKTGSVRCRMLECG